MRMATTIRGLTRLISCQFILTFQLIVRAMEGYVVKRGHIISNWKSRWLVVGNGELCYYADHSKSQLKKRVELNQEVVVEKMPALTGQNYVFLISFPQKWDLIASTANEELRNKWINTIRSEVLLLTSSSQFSTLKKDISQGTSATGISTNDSCGRGSGPFANQTAKRCKPLPLVVAKNKQQAASRTLSIETTSADQSESLKDNSTGKCYYQSTYISSFLFNHPS
jgi:hypothetical protein